MTDSREKVSVLEGLSSQRSWLQLNVLELESFQAEEHLVFSARMDDGQWLDAEACARCCSFAPGWPERYPRALPTK
ncbi:MAG: hypothetical protein M3495_13145 [Pseudomonadota bacterium]|nr:hypothetical protein [Gammaproteobacteria bacterium]MDQ3582482.1 hypothetical protein [Pseudomonadota bacterium]